MKKLSPLFVCVLLGCSSTPRTGDQFSQDLDSFRATTSIVVAGAVAFDEDSLRYLRTLDALLGVALERDILAPDDIEALGEDLRIREFSDPKYRALIAIALASYRELSVRYEGDPRLRQALVAAREALAAVNLNL